jgi:hypothetical protein
MLLHRGGVVLLKLDRTLAVLLVLGAAGHTLGSIKAYSQQPIVLLWALCASLYTVLLGVVNLLRTARPADRALAWVAVVASACWIPVSIAFGVLIGQPFDPRVVVFVLICSGLVALGLKNALGSSEAPAAKATRPPRR